VENWGAVFFLEKVLGYSESLEEETYLIVATTILKIGINLMLWKRGWNWVEGCLV
jgi:hypothetical protein